MSESSQINHGFIQRKPNLYSPLTCLYWELDTHQLRLRDEAHLLLTWKAAPLNLKQKIENLTFEYVNLLVSYVFWEEKKIAVCDSY